MGTMHPCAWFAPVQVYSVPRVRELQRLLNGTHNGAVEPGYEVSWPRAARGSSALPMVSDGKAVMSCCSGPCALFKWPVSAAYYLRKMMKHAHCLTPHQLRSANEIGVVAAHGGCQWAAAEQQPLKSPQLQRCGHPALAWRWYCLLLWASPLPCLQPEFLEPKASLSVLDAMAVLRRHFDGTVHDGYTHRWGDLPLREVAERPLSRGSMLVLAR